MGTEKRKMVYEVLKSLCLNNGWAYGVLWSSDQQKSMLLTMEDAYHEDRMGTYIENMLLLVHTLGNGMVGNAAMTKGHEWIFAENYLREVNPLGYAQNREDFQDGCEIRSQFSSGIETIAVISVEPHGVVQFGSPLKILERTQFLDQTKRLFKEIESCNEFSNLFLPQAMNSFSEDIQICNTPMSYNYINMSCFPADTHNIYPFTLDNQVIKSPCIENQLIMPNSESPKYTFPEIAIEDFDFGEIENIFNDISIPLVNCGALDFNSISEIISEQHSDFDFVPKESLFSKLGIDQSFSVSSSNSKLFSGIKRKREIYSDSTSCETSNVSQPKRHEDSEKVVKKRAKPGLRPKPKDRQQIQDRISELRKLIPNGAKMSIDSLLAQTIKHMFYLESVTKHAENIENTVAQKDNDYISTWVSESQVQLMMDPVVVKDLGLPSQKQIQIIVEEKGFFLEIVEVIQGFGLNILKGVMEVRENKIWACFIVESQGKKYVKKHEIYLSLHQLLSENSLREINLCDRLVVNGGFNLLNYHQQIFQFPVDFSDIGRL